MCVSNKSLSSCGGSGLVTAPATKVCTGCGEEKPATTEYFYKREESKDGLFAKCKLCIRDYAAKHYEKNKEKIISNMIKYYNKNRERKLAYASKYTKENPDKRKEFRNKRRARKLNAPGHFTGEEFQKLIIQTGNVCLSCGISGEEVTLHADHVIPLYHGGSNYITNIQPLCGPCNSSKGTKNTDYRHAIAS